VFDDRPAARSRVVWWGLTLGLVALALFTLYSYVGTVVFGLFIYYIARPVDRQIRTIVDRRGVAAFLSLAVFEIPFLAVAGYVLLLALRELQAYSGAGAELVARVLPVGTAEVERAIADPVAYLSSLESTTLSQVLTAGLDVLGPVLRLVLHVFLAVAIAFYLLRDGDRIAAWFREEVGEDSALLTYAELVDRDLRIVYFGNIRTVVVVAVLGIVVYNSLNLVAPPGLTIPLPNVLALLTGAATLIPVVVGKVVYLPLAAYLANAAIETDPGALWFPVLVAVTALLVLDLFPIMLVRPLLAGQSTHGGLMMFSYIFGGLLFGWYGIFLGPLLLVLGIHLIRVGFSELAHGEEITPAVTTAPQLGSMPDVREEPASDPDSEPESTAED
jgi:predicted PurR-regulated permease PerM